MQLIRKSLDRLESDKWLAIQLMLVFTIAFAIYELPEIFTIETYPDYSLNVMPVLNECDTESMLQLRGFLQYQLLCISQDYFNNEKLLPYLTGIAIVIVSFFFARQFAKSNLAGLIAMGILISSGNFFVFNTSSTYPQFWALFFLLAIYFIRNYWYLSPAFFILSAITKPLPLLYLPLVIAFVMLSDVTRQTKIRLAGIYSGITILFATVVFIRGDLIDSFGGTFDYNQTELLVGFFSWFFLLDSSLIIAVSIPVVLIQLIIKRKSLQNATALFVLILGIILAVPLVEGFTNQLNHAYRFVPLLVFVGTAIAMLVSNLIISKKQAQTLNVI